MRARHLLITAFVLAAACEAGHRDGDGADPGGDNAFPGPELAIIAPGPGQTFPVWKVVTEPGEDGQEQRRRVYKLPVALFDLRNAQRPDRRAGDRVHYILDRGPPRVVEDPTKPLALEDGEPRPQPSGTRVLRAWVAKADGTPYANPQACAVRLFHLGGEDGAYDVRGGSEALRAPFRDDGPHLVVLPPEGTTLRFAVTGVHLGRRSHRVLVRRGEDEVALYRAGAVDLGSRLPWPGTGDLTVELQALVGGEEGPVWQLAPGPFNAETFTTGS